MTDREVWSAAIHGVAKSQTRLSDWTELNWTEYRDACSALPLLGLKYNWFEESRQSGCMEKAFERSCGLWWYSSQTLAIWKQVGPGNKYPGLPLLTPHLLPVCSINQAQLVQSVLGSPCCIEWKRAEWRVDLDGTMEYIWLRIDWKHVLYSYPIVLSSARGAKTK